MDSVGTFAAKTHLAALLKRVARGATIQITRRGVPVALLLPVSSPRRRSREKLVAEIRELRKGNLLGGMAIRELLSEGRRF